MDSFKPVSFALAVIAVDDIEAGTPENFASQISEIVDFDKFEDHQGILAHASGSKAVTRLIMKRKSTLILEREKSAFL